MNRLAAAVRRALMLRARHVVAFAVSAFGLMMHALATGVPPALAWPLYAASAYALAVIVVAAVRACRRLSRMPLPAFLEARPLVRRWRADLHLRIGVGLAAGLATNLLCVALKLVVGLFTGNGWLVALGGYYAVLAFMRMVLIAGFGGGDAVFPRVMNSVTGGFVCLAVLAMGVHMVVRSGRARSASGA